MTRKKVKFSPQWKKNKKKIYLFSVSTKSISSHVFKISEISLVLRIREMTDIFNTFDEIYFVFTSKSKYPLLILREICIYIILKNSFHVILSIMFTRLLSQRAHELRHELRLASLIRFVHSSVTSIFLYRLISYLVFWNFIQHHNSAVANLI